MLTCGEQPVITGKQAVEQMHLLACTGDHLRGCIDFSAGLHLIKVPYMRLHGEVAAASFNIGGVNTAHTHECVRCLREAIEITRFVHMAVIVGPFGWHAPPHGFNRLVDIIIGGRWHRVIERCLPRGKGLAGAPVIGFQPLHDGDKIIVADSFQLAD